MARDLWPIPEIPGIKLDDPTVHSFLSGRVAELCGLRDSRFPGSQPISMSTEALSLLETYDFWVCEKSDGIRLLIFIVMNGLTNQQELWLASVPFNEAEMSKIVH